MIRLISAAKRPITALLLSSVTLMLNPAWAQSDKQAMDAVQRARQMTQQDHSKHNEPADESQKFRGVFYGYLPCADCSGVKMTLSLKNKRNYLLVTQYAKASSRELYDKGKYVWDDNTRILTLISRKSDQVSRYTIKDDETLIPFKEDDTPRLSQQDEYALNRSDAVKSREVHIH